MYYTVKNLKKLQNYFKAYLELFKRFNDTLKFKELNIY